MDRRGQVGARREAGCERLGLEGKSKAASLPKVPMMRWIVDADTVYAALGEPARRRILEALFDRQPRRAKALSASAGKRFEATLKHLEALLTSGLIVTEQDPTDTRRRLYTLAPSVKTATTPEGRTMDFGYCVVRVGVL